LLKSKEADNLMENTYHSKDTGTSFDTRFIGIFLVCFIFISYLLLSQPNQFDITSKEIFIPLLLLALLSVAFFVKYYFDIRLIFKQVIVNGNKLIFSNGKTAKTISVNNIISIEQLYSDEKISAGLENKIEFLLDSGETIISYDLIDSEKFFNEILKINNKIKIDKSFPTNYTY